MCVEQRNEYACCGKQEYWVVACNKASCSTAEESKTLERIIRQRCSFCTEEIAPSQQPVSQGPVIAGLEEIQKDDPKIEAFPGLAALHERRVATRVWLLMDPGKYATLDEALDAISSSGSSGESFVQLLAAHQAMSQ